MHLVNQLKCPKWGESVNIGKDPQRQELKMFSIIMQSWLICTCKSQCTDCNFCTITVRRFLSNKYAKYARTNVYKIREFFSTCMCKNREHNSLV